MYEYSDHVKQLRNAVISLLRPSTSLLLYLLLRHPNNSHANAHAHAHSHAHGSINTLPSQASTLGTEHTTSNVINSYLLLRLLIDSLNPIFRPRRAARMPSIPVSAPTPTPTPTPTATRTRTRGRSRLSDFANVNVNVDGSGRVRIGIWVCSLTILGAGLSSLIWISLLFGEYDERREDTTRHEMRGSVRGAWRARILLMGVCSSCLVILFCSTFRRIIGFAESSHLTMRYVTTLTKGPYLVTKGNIVRVLIVTFGPRG